MKKKFNKGFSLIELMVVIVIIGLLASIVVVNVLPSQDRAMIEKAKTDIALLEQAAEMYKLDMFTYPKAEDGLLSLLKIPRELSGSVRYREGGYIKRLPKDPWGNNYQYKFPGEKSNFDIFSFGADGKLGGEGTNEDIYPF